MCGAAKNYRGKPFRDASDIAQHQRRMHGIEVTESNGNGAAKSALNDNGARPTHKVREALANHMKFCPQCGFNMEVINAAMSFVNGE